MLVPDFVTRRLLLSRVEMIYLEHTWRITTLAGWIIKKKERENNIPNYRYVVNRGISCNDEITWL